MTDMKTDAYKAEKRKRKKVSNRLTVILLIASLATVCALVFNVVHILRAQSGSSENTNTTADTQNTMRNDQYVIGNNPTELEKQYFQELTELLAGDDKQAIAESVVKNFVADYFTWRNKDGNFEVGGLQYILGSGYYALNKYTIWNYGKNFDLYLSQYGKEHLPEVSEVRIVESFQDEDFEIGLENPKRIVPCYKVSYECDYVPDTVLDTSSFPNKGDIKVVVDNDRMSIVEIISSGPAGLAQ